MGGDVRRTGARPRAGREATDLEALAGHVEAELRATAELATRTADTLSGAVAELAVMVVETLASGGRLLFCGNGGSAADAQHLAAEYVVRFGRQREALPALALTADACVLTASGNDFGFEEVFARQIEGLGARAFARALDVRSSRNEVVRVQLQHELVCVRENAHVPDVHGGRDGVLLRGGLLEVGEDDDHLAEIIPEHVAWFPFVHGGDPW